MTTAQAVGAVSREAAEWYAINWQPSTACSPTPSAYSCRHEGKQMGQGASLATFANPLYSGKVLAVRRVTENNGKATPVWTKKFGTHREENTGSTCTEA